MLGSRLSLVLIFQSLQVYFLKMRQDKTKLDNSNDNTEQINKFTRQGLISVVSLSLDHPGAQKYLKCLQIKNPQNVNLNPQGLKIPEIDSQQLYKYEAQLIIFTYRSMLEYLILNGKFEAAKHYHENSQTTLREELLNHFNKGNRIEFMDLFTMLHKQSKLEFYLRVYFLVYSIHPSLRGKGAIPEPQKIAFKDYLDNKGSQLAKTSEFLQFYALPFIKKPLQHLAFKNLFKKEWVTNLKQKLEIFVAEQERILKTEIAKVFQNQSNPATSSNQSKVHQQKVKQMQKINKKLFEEVKQFTEKYHVLEDSYKTMMDSYQTHMMQSQSKWFQITKELVECSKNLIQMLITSDSDCVNDRRFLKIKKRTEKYERFVSKKFDDLVSHSEDISIFDRPSISELSYSITPHSQKVLHTHTQQINTVNDYISTDFPSLKQFLKKSTNQQKISVINGLYWRILKSKSKEVRKLNILGILHYDVLGIRTGQIQNMLVSRLLMKPIVRLIQVISLDNLGKKIAFEGDLIRDFVGLVSQCQDPSCFQYIISVLGQISSQKAFKSRLIDQDIIQVCVSTLRSGKYNGNEAILENIVAIMLNMLEKSEGLRKYEREKDIFQILKQSLRSNVKITRALIYGIIFALLESQQLFRRAHAQKLPQFFSNIQKIDPTINRTQLKYLKNRLSKFQPKQKQEERDDDDAEVMDQEEDYDIEEEYIQELDEMMKAHDEILKEFVLSGKEGVQQSKEVKNLLEEYRENRVPQFHTLQQVKIISKVSSPKPKIEPYVAQTPTPYIKQGPTHEQLSKSEKHEHRKVNNYLQPQPTANPKQNHSHVQSRERPNRFYADRYADQKAKEKQREAQAQEDSRRMKKSVSADRGIGKNIENNKIYQSNRFTNKVSEFKASEEHKYRSPQQNKKPREEVLRQLNEQIKAQQMQREKRKAGLTENNRQNHAALYTSERSRRPDEQAFQSRPKLRRTPPRQ